MIIKNDQLRKMGEKELDNKLLELKKSLLKMNAQIASGTVPENPGDLKNIKKMVAKIYTFKEKKEAKTDKK